LQKRDEPDNAGFASRLGAKFFQLRRVKQKFLAAAAGKLTSFKEGMLKTSKVSPTCPSLAAF
jgi:hypothetical protein